MAHALDLAEGPRTAPRMLALSVQSPFAAPPRPAGDAVARALGVAETVSGAYADPPCRFHRLGAVADSLLGPAVAETGSWVLVAVRGSAEPGHQAHLRERCLTAAQRFMLALACDGVDSEWVGEGVPDAEAFRDAGLDLGAAVPVGLVWCADD